jgi:hypothetical protein
VTLSTTSQRPELEVLINRFNATFMTGALWPTKDDLHRFRELIPLAYRELGNKTPKAINFWGMVKAVDKRWVKVGIRRSVERMVARCVLVVPPGPRRRLQDLLATKTGETQNDHTLFKLLGQVSVRKEGTKSSEFIPLLDKLLSEDTTAVLGKVAGTLNNPNDIGWLKFLDVHRQALAWRVEYEAGFSAFAFWVYSLRHDPLAAKLDTIGWRTSRLPTQEEWLRNHKKAVDRTRQKKLRQKRTENLPKTVTPGFDGKEED